MFVYSVTNLSSLQYLQTVFSIIARVRSSLKEAHVPIILVSTYNDASSKSVKIQLRHFLTYSKVSLAEAKEVATTFESPLFETIANDPNDKRVQEAFLEMIRQIYLVRKAKTCKITNFF